jgi:xylan 1,4-beta-xylosidase
MGALLACSSTSKTAPSGSGGSQGGNAATVTANATLGGSAGDVAGATQTGPQMGGATDAAAGRTGFYGGASGGANLSTPSSLSTISTGGSSTTGGTTMGGSSTSSRSGGTAAGGNTGTGGQQTPGEILYGGPCSDLPPWGKGDGDVQLVVDAGHKGQTWSRFYENGVALDHASTILTTAYGRNVQSALKKGRGQAGFRYVRFHGILNDDIGVYSEVDGKAVYDWTRLDQVFDAIVTADLWPMVGISFTPTALASTSKVASALWYNNQPPNISKPNDWTKWEDLMKALVQHLESRYGIEVRNNWLFEVWNEPSWMYEAGNAGYNELYAHTFKGLTAAVPSLRVGGPAGAAGESPALISDLISYTKSNKLELHFITFHHFANDNDGKVADANAMLSFYDSIREAIPSSKFSGNVINDEFGSSLDAVVTRDNEVAASFIAKTVHLIGADSKAGPPYMYAWRSLSDLSEVSDTRHTTAFAEGNYGLLLKGDPAIPASFDVAKPAFNSFRMLHLLGDVRIDATGGTKSDGVNALATTGMIGTVQVLVYNHVAGGTADSSKSSQVKLTVNNIPGSYGFEVMHYMLDRTHANAYQAWVDLGKPAKPNATQWTQIAKSGELCFFQSQGSGSSWTVTYPQNVYGVSLFLISPRLR